MKSVAYKIPRPAWRWPAEEALIFNQARAKLYQARIHAFHVSESWEILIDNHINTITGRKPNPPNSPEHLPINIESPFWMGLTLGDCIRNLRSSLDYLVSAMAREVGLDDSHTIFPFNKERARLVDSFEELTAKGKKKADRQLAIYKLNGHYPQLENIILKQVQPYSADDGAHALGHLLWSVITADNIDKHRLLVLTTGACAIEHMEFTDGSTWAGFTMEGNCLLKPSDVKVKGDPDVTFNILFAEPASLARKPVTDTLVETCNAVDEVIGIFAAAFER